MTTSDSDSQSAKYNAPALSKGLDILELLASQNKGMKKSEIAKSMGRSVSEIFRMLAVLSDRGYVALDTTSDTYALTPRLFEIAHRHPPIRRLNAVAGEIMEKLAQELNQSVHLAILHGTDILVIAQSDPLSNNITTVRLGARVPLIFTSSGAILTSQFDSAQLQDLMSRMGDHTPEQHAYYQKNLEDAREHRVCECPSSVIAGIHNISVPVFSYSGEIVAALTTPYMKRLHTHNDPPRDVARKALIAAGHRLSERIGAGAAHEDTE
ncbi:IclR family transcriptional regulator [Falsihalocynthiibacter sp. SS001]|uniref:IclR family transcriptional regulator n=1 Tax=Falsihalocynthiibacter sp. SS001 TaxID=3349698 RepID=UPI0036D36664